MLSKEIAMSVMSSQSPEVSKRKQDDHFDSENKVC